eukprot:TRINITY_DN10237_c2_g1_i1.p1 TRINITY_DN10237_c2_g1~~TRINITY_DN10237_c2_g1_i1.p1  ORF type:complete len:308 (+),score=74.58 TRINITY_DN10237_c2_g1_i1:1758-2681(+)
MSSPLLDSHMLPFAHFDSYATSTEEEVIAPLEAPKPIVASAPKRKNKVTKKRKRVGRACVFCQRSHMSCDEQRPCKRCVARGCGDQCRDGKRKRRGRKRKTPLPDDENSIDDEFDEFEPAEKQFKDDSDTEEDVEDEHAHCNHGTADAHDHHHHHHHTAPAANHGDIQLFDDEEEENSSLSHSSSSVPFMKIKSEYEEEMAAPSRPTTPAIPVPLRNPRLTIISHQTAASSAPEESASPSSNQHTFESVYPSFFEPHPSSEATSAHHGSSSIDVDSFFAAEPHCGSRVAPLAYFEANNSFEQADAIF